MTHVGHIARRDYHILRLIYHGEMYDTCRSYSKERLPHIVTHIPRRDVRHRYSYSKEMGTMKGGSYTKKRLPHIVTHIAKGYVSHIVTHIAKRDVPHFGTHITRIDVT